MLLLRCEHGEQYAYQHAPFDFFIFCRPVGYIPSFMLSTVASWLPSITLGQQYSQGKLAVYRAPGVCMSALTQHPGTAGHCGFQKLPFVVVLGIGLHFN
jgi:hypothetical protein